jgi:RNA polymerase sigma-70 factor (ECF subfamily)
MEQKELLPKLFRTQYQKIVSVLCAHFGIKHIEIAEDLVSETFLAATESWPINGIPPNPEAWLYTVAKNKAKNHFTRAAIYEQKISPELKKQASETDRETEIDLSEKNISDSQLAMMFAICHPTNTDEAQIALALNILCGFGANEIADAFLTTKEAIYKRLSRAKERLKEKNNLVEYPTPAQIDERLGNVLKTIYLLFSEGYYSSSQDVIVSRDLCAEAMRLCYHLLQNEATNLPPVNALIALMWFHTSRFGARIGQNGQTILFDNQDKSLWNEEFIANGTLFLSRSAAGPEMTKYHLEAAIAYWHTQKDDVRKWENILTIYDKLLVLDYSPMAALNRIYALSKVKGKQVAIDEAEKLTTIYNNLYFSLLGNLFTGIDDKKALEHYQMAIELTKGAAEKNLLLDNIKKLQLPEN